MAVLAGSAVAAGSQSGSSSNDSGPSSVPFRGSSVPKSRKAKASSSAKASSPSTAAAASSYSTWLILDADERALPFLRSLHPGSSSPLASGSSSPAARSSEKLTESTNTTSSRPVPATASVVRSQASKYENGLASSAVPEEGKREKDRRMSLQNQGGSGKRGFMSRLRAAGGSVSGAHAFHPPSNTMSTSGSWSIVDPPTPIKEHPVASASSRTVHLAFTTLASEAAVQRASGLIGRASSLLLPSSTPGSTEPVEKIHSARLDVAGLSSLVSTTNTEAVYIGSAWTTSDVDKLRPYLEPLLSSASSALKTVLFEPAAVRQLTTGDAAALHELARSRSITLLLPIRWASLWTTSIEETLLGLEILHDLHEEEAYTLASSISPVVNGDADVSTDKSFDVSMSNIPTGLSGDGLNKVAELDALRTQMEQLKRELGNRDRRIVELTKQNEGQSKQLQQQVARTEVATSDLVSSPTVVEEPKAPLPSPGAPGARTRQAATPAVQTKPEARTTGDAAAAQTPGSQVGATPSSTSVPVSTPAPFLPSPSTSQQLAAAIASPTNTTATTSSATTTLAPAAPITPAPSTPSRNPTSPFSATTSSPSSSSSKVIASLNAELSETRSLLEATRSALATVRSQSAAYQAAADEMRSTLSRARLENDSSISILARKDRQISEALERARKAEGEAKELGRASREWGTRIREVEEDLGKERMKRSRAEQQYETLGAEWKTARTRLVEEVRALREEHRRAVEGLKEEYDKVSVFKQRLLEESSLLSSNDDSTDPAAAAAAVVVAPTKLVAQLTQLNEAMRSHLDAQMQPLLSQLRQFEQRETSQVVDKLQYLTDELTRIKTLMRRGDVTSASQVAPGPF